MAFYWFGFLKRFLIVLNDDFAYNFGRMVYFVKINAIGQLAGVYQGIARSRFLLATIFSTSCVTCGDF